MRGWLILVSRLAVVLYIAIELLALLLAKCPAFDQCWASDPCSQRSMQSHGVSGYTMLSPTAEKDQDQHM